MSATSRIGFVLWLTMIALVAMGLSALGSLIPSKANAVTAVMPAQCEQHKGNPDMLNTCLERVWEIEDQMTQMDECEELMELPTSQNIFFHADEDKIMISADLNNVTLTYNISTRLIIGGVIMAFLAFWLIVSVLLAMIRLLTAFLRRSIQQPMANNPAPIHIHFNPQILVENHPDFNNT